MSKLIIRNRYATTPNSLLLNPEVSLRAKGLYGYIQSKPDGWKFSAERMAHENREGLQSIRSALKELEKYGYLKRKKTQVEGGHWSMEYILNSEPIIPDSNPADENGTSETLRTKNPTSDCPTSENNADNSNKDFKKKDLIKKEDNIYPSFDDFWNLYAKKVSRNTCEKKWKNLKQEDKIKIMEHIPIYFKYQPDPQFRKLPETFLNKRSWEDELETPSTIQKSKTKITMF